jgi:hypothetical protein
MEICVCGHGKSEHDESGCTHSDMYQHSGWDVDCDCPEFQKASEQQRETNDGK